MAKKQPRKITHKNIQYSLNVNVNDEAFPGFKRLQNIDTNSVIGAVKSRYGISQSDLLPTVVVGNYEQYDSITPTAGTLDMYEFMDFSIGKLENVGIVYTPANSGSINRITIDSVFTTITPTNYAVMQVYEYDLTTETKSALIAESATATLPSTDFTFTPFTVVKNKTYILILAIQSGIALNPNEWVVRYKGTADIKNFTVAIRLSPTQPDIYVPHPTQAMKTTVYMSPLAQAELPKARITMVRPTADSLIYSSQENLLNMPFGIGSLSKVKSGITTKLIDPSALAPISTLFPNAIYGAKLEEDVHMFGCFLGSALTGRATEDNSVYPMFKKVKGEDKIIPVTSDVTVSEIKVAYNVGSGVQTGPTQDFPDGIYEYCVEYIDKTGFPYATAPTVLRTSTYKGIPTASHFENGNYGELSEDAMVTHWNAQSIPNKQSIYSRTYREFISVPLPTAPIYNGLPEDYPIINLYRRNICIVTSENSILNTPDSSFELIKTFYPEDYAVGSTRNLALTGYADNNQTFPDGYFLDFYTTVNGSPVVRKVTGVTRTTLAINDYYMPRPVDFCFNKGHIIAAGDPTYPNYIFPSRDYRTDFHIEDIYSVSFPLGDSKFTAAVTFMDDAFIFSAHGTWRMRMVSTTAPYFQIQQVSSRLGCVATSKAIVQYGQLLMLPTSEGLMWFDGYNFTPADNSINNIWNNMEITEKSVLLGGPGATPIGHIPAFDLSAAYDQSTKSIIYMLPKVELDTTRTLYVFNTKIKQWSTYSFGATVDTLFTDYNNNGVGLVTIGNESVSPILYTFSDVNDYDYLYDLGYSPIDIATVLESQDIDFGEPTTFQKFRLWGSGLVDVNVYFDREATTVCTYTDVDMDANGEIGIELPMGWTGNYLRFELIAKDSATFMLKAFEIAYSNSGVKKFRQIAE